MYPGLSRKMLLTKMTRMKRNCLLVVISLTWLYLLRAIIYDIILDCNAEAQIYKEWHDHALQSPAHRTFVNMSALRKYTVNNNVCHSHYKEEYLAILLVTSRLQNFRRRSHQRNSMSDFYLQQFGLKRVFLVGVAANDDHDADRRLRSEIAENGDVLRGDFRDTYRNNSLKNLMGLDWAARECSGASFIVKMDDDIIFDIYALVEILLDLRATDYELAVSGELLMGKAIRRRQPFRVASSKWLVTADEYKASQYPAYLMGCLFVTNAATVRRVVALADREPVYWIDDIWLTGLLRTQLGIQLTAWPAGIYTTHTDELERCIRDLEVYNLRCDRLFYHKTYEPKLLYRFNAANRKCHMWGSELECRRRTRLNMLKTKLRQGWKTLFG